jgi:uncharacterized membrane protein
VIAGEIYYSSGPSRAFVWSGGRSLRLLPPGISHVTGISSDGSAVVGWTTINGHDRGVRWTAADRLTRIAILRGSDGSYPRGVNFDGSVVVGGSWGGSRPFRWLDGTGIFALPVASTGATAVDFDGSIVAGCSRSTSDGIRWVIGSTTQAQDLQSTLLALGAAGQHWCATSISADGTVIGGFEQSLGKAWVARLPLPTNSAGLSSQYGHAQRVDAFRR